MKIGITGKKVTVKEINFDFEFGEFNIPTNSLVKGIINLLVKSKLIDKPQGELLLDRNFVIEMDKGPIYPKLYTQLAVLMKEKQFPTSGNEYVKANYILSSFFEACERCGESCFSIIDVAKPKKQEIPIVPLSQTSIEEYVAEPQIVTMIPATDYVDTMEIKPMVFGKKRYE